ncbi:hypothetical protein K3495_g13589 [Podosphaera aphanis]|nr:hypothetical protein K3495_g13589 [Podosphaera aphanis]
MSLDLKVSKRILEALEKINNTLAQISSSLRAMKEPDVASQNPIITQAQVMAQDDQDLKDEGKAFMVEYFTDPKMAGVYLAFKYRDLRRVWLRNQFFKTGRNSGYYFIEH